MGLTRFFTGDGILTEEVCFTLGGLAFLYIRADGGSRSQQLATKRARDPRLAIQNKTQPHDVSGKLKSPIWKRDGRSSAKNVFMLFRFHFTFTRLPSPVPNSEA